MRSKRFKYSTASTGPDLARECGRSCLYDMRGFTLIEVQVAVVVFVLGIVGLLGYTRVNNALIASAEAARSVDGYADLASERAIVVIASEPGGAEIPPCNVRLKNIDEDGTYPVVEVTVTRSTP